MYVICRLHKACDANLPKQGQPCPKADSLTFATGSTYKLFFRKNFLSYRCETLTPCLHPTHPYPPTIPRRPKHYLYHLKGKKQDITINHSNTSSIITSESSMSLGTSTKKKWMIAKSYFWGPLETVFSLLWYLEHLFRILGLVHVLKERFLCPYNVPYSPYKSYNKNFFLYFYSLQKASS